MQAIKFPGQNGILGKPIDMTDEECGSLPIRHSNEHGYPTIESVWELSDADMEAIQKSRRIQLTVVGGVHPPVGLQVSPWVGQLSVDVVNSGPKNPPITPGHHPVG